MWRAENLPGVVQTLLTPPPRPAAERYRHELKYLISYGEKAALETRMRPILQMDPHAGSGGYFIRSLYFDDYWHSAYEEKEAGVLLRKKYRIRIYDNSDRIIKLERKKKFGSWIYKEDAILTRAEFEKILAGEYAFLLQSEQNLCREFYYECVSQLLRPRVSARHPAQSAAAGLSGIYGGIQICAVLRQNRLSAWLWLLAGNGGLPLRYPTVIRGVI